jgi:hypothetical protein
LVVAKYEERRAVNKRPVKKMVIEGLNLKKLNEGEVKEKYQVTMKKKFVALGNLEHNGDINRAWGTIREKIKL